MDIGNTYAKVNLYSEDQCTLYILHYVLLKNIKTCIVFEEWIDGNQLRRQLSYPEKR